MRSNPLLLTLLAIAVSVIPARADLTEAATVPATAAVPVALRHELGQSYMYLRVHDDSLIVRVEMTVEDLGRALGTGWTAETFGNADLERELDRVRAYMEPRFELAAGGSAFPLRFRAPEVLDLGVATYATLTYVVDGIGEIPDEIEIEMTWLFDIESDHLNMLVIEHNWKTSTFNNEANVSLIFSPRSPEQSLDRPHRVYQPALFYLRKLTQYCPNFFA